MLRAAAALAITAASIPPVAGVVMALVRVDYPREPPGYDNLLAVINLGALAIACFAAALFVTVDIRRGEQRRIWDDYVGGRPAVLHSTVGMAVVLGVGSIAPVASFLLVRVPIGGCVVFNVFGLPWPPLVESTVLIAAAVITAVAWIVTLGGLRVASVRSASAAILRYWAWLLVPGFLVLFISVWGDLAPDSVCRSTPYGSTPTEARAIRSSEPRPPSMSAATASDAASAGRIQVISSASCRGSQVPVTGTT